MLGVIAVREVALDIVEISRYRKVEIAIVHPDVAAEAEGPDRGHECGQLGERRNCLANLSLRCIVPKSEHHYVADHAQNVAVSPQFVPNTGKNNRFSGTRWRGLTAWVCWSHCPGEPVPPELALAKTPWQLRSIVAKDRVERDEEDLVRLYLTDIGQYTLLTKDDEVRLAKLIESGKVAAEALEKGGKELSPAKKRDLRKAAREGEDAQQAFVQSNLRLVVSIAKKYQASGLPLLDLIQEGNLGLMHAVEKFDWRKGFKFSTYATWWIRQAITRGIANTGRTIRLPVHAGDTLARLQKARARLELKLGRPSTLAELSAERSSTTSPNSASPSSRKGSLSDSGSAAKRRASVTLSSGISTSAASSRRLG